MKIAYIASYSGPMLAEKSGVTISPTSSTIKAQSIARSLMAAGHEVTIFSIGFNHAGKKIASFDEIVEFPEGKLTIKYPTLYSYLRMTPVNNITRYILLRKEVKVNNYNVLLYYNICDNSYLGSYMYLHLFKDKFRILEYEDNIFMKSLVGAKTRYTWLKKLIYKYLINRTDGLFAVCSGMYRNEPVKHKLLTPGIINQEVVSNVSSRVNRLSSDRPVKIFLAGGGEYFKGSDLLVKALHRVEKACELHFFSFKEAFYSAATDEIEKLPSQHKVVLHDLIPHDQLIKLLDAEADILANTTRGFGIDPTTAGFPSKMMEYAALGRPIVSSEIGKLDNQFNCRVTYYEGEDDVDLARCINEIINQYDEKVKLALELQQIALTQYTIEGTAYKMKTLFSEIDELNRK